MYNNTVVMPVTHSEDIENILRFLSYIDIGYEDLVKFFLSLPFHERMIPVNTFNHLVNYISEQVNYYYNEHFSDNYLDDDSGYDKEMIVYLIDELEKAEYGPKSYTFDGDLSGLVDKFIYYYGNNPVRLSDINDYGHDYINENLLYLFNRNIDLQSVIT